MRKAIISAEDARFLDHKGVDPLATVRAAYRDLSGAAPRAARR
jgi:membrane peptidoglycan carboxypeptidase